VDDYKNIIFTFNADGNIQYAGGEIDEH